MDDNQEKLKPKVLKRTEIGNNSFIRVMSVDVEGPDGRKANYMQFDRPNSSDRGAAVLPLLRDGRLVMQQEYRLGADKWIITIPKGGSENKQESIELTAAREMREEAGLEAEFFIPLGFSYNAPSLSPSSAHHILAFDCRDVGREDHAEAGEWIAGKLTYNLAQLRQLMHSGAIEDCQTLGTLAFFLDAVRVIDDKHAEKASAALIGGVINTTLGLKKNNPYPNADDSAHQDWEKGITLAHQRA